MSNKKIKTIIFSWLQLLRVDLSLCTKKINRNSDNKQFYLGGFAIKRNMVYYVGSSVSQSMNYIDHNNNEYL